MNANPTFRLSEDPLQQAKRALVRIRKLARNSAFVPIPVIALAAAAFFKYEPHWYSNPFLAVIFAIFATGQIMAVFQMRRVLAGVRSTGKSILVLAEAGDEPDLPVLRGKLLENAPPGHMRDLLLRWIELGMRGETTGSESLLNNAWDRRAHHDNSSVSIHVSMNRTTLKLGFLGTLYGLILTFPPMQRAVMGLSDSDGELRFIKDISMAIDGDEFAIAVTLGATALSILIELVTIQILERALGGFDMVNSHINDWNLTRLQPWVKKRYGLESRQRLAVESQAVLEAKMTRAHQEMDANLGRALEAIARTTKQLDQLAMVQAAVGRRIAELVEYEKQYRGFIESKTAAVAPLPPHDLDTGRLETSHIDNARLEDGL
ncbi:MAG TPA: hypothetical protein VJ385_15375 [Fibrobacteria bacterium]|nr:hypothetical protein [Fibrobacteria bacterium]